MPFTTRVVPEPDRVRVLLDASRFAPLLIVQTPLTFTEPPSVTTSPVFAIVRLFNAATLLGTVIPLAVPPKTRLEDEVVPKFAGVPAIAGPFNVSVLVEIARVPAVNVSVPPTVTLPPNVIVAPERLMVRSFNVTAGNDVLPEPA